MEINQINKHLADCEQENALTRAYDSRPNRGKRIVLRKIAREVGIQHVEDEHGNQVEFGEWEYRNKYLDHKAYQWPTGESSIDFESTKGDGVRIANYRYPVQVGVERKGILFYVHGYGCNVHNHAYLAEMFARAGYEFCGMDQRGFGKSEGVRGRIESADLCLADAMKFNEAYYEKYGTAGGKRAPCFLLGNSLGGLLAACMAAENHMDYAGACLTVPYFGMKDKQLLERLRPVAQVMSRVSPNQSIPLRDGKPVKKHLQEWINDPLHLGTAVTPHNLVQNDAMMQRLASERIAERTTTPSLLIRAGGDDLVDNKAIQDFFRTIPVTDKQMMTYDEVNHSIFQDGEYLPLVVRDIVSWMDARAKES